MIVGFSDNSNKEGLPGPLARLSEYLCEQKDLRGYTGLEADIASAGASTHGGKIERRRLAEIVLGKAKALGVRELLALDSYLAQQGTSLGQLLQRKSIFDSLASLPDVTLMVGAYPARDARQVGDHLSSWWDLHAVTSLAYGAAQSSATRWRPEDVWLQWPTQRKARGGSRSPAAPAVQGTKWHSLLQQDGVGIVAIASPYANHATEVILAEMEGVTPFQPRNASHDAYRNASHDAFRFIWSPAVFSSRPSSFSENGSATLPQIGGAARHSGRSCWGMRVRDEVHSIDEVEGRWSALGIIAAQWRMNGQLRVVLAGSTGPATLACARLLPNIPAVVPPASPEAHGTPIWVPVRSGYSSESEVTSEVSASALFAGEHAVVVGMGSQG